MTETRAADPRPALARLGTRPGLGLAFLVSLVLGLAVSFATDRVLSAHEVLRGVSVLGVRLTGLDEDAARKQLVRLARELSERPVHITVQSHRFDRTLGELGLRLDVPEHLKRALDAGRAGSLPAQAAWWLTRLFRDAPVEAKPTFDEARLSAEVDRWEADLVRPRAFRGDVKVSGSAAAAEYPHDGFVVARAPLHEALVSLVTTGASELSVPLDREQPVLDRAAVNAALEIAKGLLKAPIRLVPPAPPPTDEEAVDDPPKSKPADEDAKVPSPPPIVLRREDLASALRTELHTDPPRLDVSLDPARVKELLDAERGRIETPSRSATFDVDRRGKITVVPSTIGRSIDEAKLPALLLALSKDPSREGPLPMIAAAPPDLSTAEAKTLGIEKLVSKFTTYHACCQPRVQNIHRIADLLDGVVVRPGARFSVNDTLGPRTQQNGFVLAPTIVEGDMEKTVGGGISQFATTMFNAVLDGGYEIIQRQPHSYYFSRYPVGHEATLSFPSPDLIFRNDTKAGMLIKTEYGSKFIRVLVYGNNGGRKISRKVGPHIDRVAPPIEYVGNELIPPDAAKLVRRGVIGWSVIVSRTITEPDGSKRSQSRKVTYNPKPRVVEVHPCNIPEGEPGYTGEDCPEPELPDGGGGDGAERKGLVSLEGIRR